MGSCLDVCAEPKLLDASGGEWFLAWRGLLDLECLLGCSLRSEQRSQNWSGQGMGVLN